MKFVLLVAMNLFIMLHATSQILSYSDPAISYQRILLERSGEGSYQQIGNFKVKGTSYLFGTNHKGDVYTSKEKAEGVRLSYNTYNQQIDVYQNDNDKPLLMALKDVDSFRMIIQDENAIQSVLLFINGTLLDKSKKFFVQEVYDGPKYSLYKAYSSVMGYVSTNYVQSELRQFDLNYDYYYRDITNGSLKKLKASAKNVKATFNSIMDVSKLADSEEFDTNPEYVLKQIFSFLNSK